MNDKYGDIIFQGVKLSPCFKDYIWGGSKIKSIFQKQGCPDRIGESWEVASHLTGQCFVASGVMAGSSFSAYLRRIGKKGLGEKGADLTYFPLLVKFIDARENLSVQVHPNDAFALAYDGDYGKSELWYIMDSDENALVYLGFKEDVTAKEVKEAAENGTLLALMNKIPVKKGDVFFIKAGTVHAIGKGILLCEIQQNSNVTYRLYDYGRQDENGVFRELHLDKGLQVLDFKKYENPLLNRPEDKGQNKIFAQKSCFSVWKYNIKGNLTLTTGEDSFTIFVFLSGNVALTAKDETGEKDQRLSFKGGDACFFPSCKRKISFNGVGEFLKITL